MSGSQFFLLHPYRRMTPCEEDPSPILGILTVTRTSCMIYHPFPGCNLCNADAAQPLTMAGEDFDDVDNNLSEV